MWRRVSPSHTSVPTWAPHRTYKTLGSTRAQTGRHRLQVQVNRVSTLHPGHTYIHSARDAHERFAPMVGCFDNSNAAQGVFTQVLSSEYDTWSNEVHTARIYEVKGDVHSVDSNRFGWGRDLHVECCNKAIYDRAGYQVAT